MTVKTHTTDNEKQKITLSDKAIKHVRAYIKKRGSGIGIRLATEERGCSGLAYVVSYVDEAAEDDFVFVITDDISVFVDRLSFTVVKGTHIDYVREGLNEHFTYENPNEKGSCGCGESFTI